MSFDGEVSSFSGGSGEEVEVKIGLLLSGGLVRSGLAVVKANG